MLQRSPSQTGAVATHSGLPLATASDVARAPSASLRQDPYPETTPLGTSGVVRGRRVSSVESGVSFMHREGFFLCFRLSPCAVSVTVHRLSALSFLSLSFSSGCEFVFPSLVFPSQSGSSYPLRRRVQDRLSFPVSFFRRFRHRSKSSSGSPCVIRYTESSVPSTPNRSLSSPLDEAWLVQFNTIHQPDAGRPTQPTRNPISTDPQAEYNTK